MSMACSCTRTYAHPGARICRCCCVGDAAVAGRCCICTPSRCLPGPARPLSCLVWPGAVHAGACDAELLARCVSECLTCPGRCWPALQPHPPCVRLKTSAQWARGGNWLAAVQRHVRACVLTGEEAQGRRVGGRPALRAALRGADGGAGAGEDADAPHAGGGTGGGDRGGRRLPQ